MYLRIGKGMEVYRSSHTHTSTHEWKMKTRRNEDIQNRQKNAPPWRVHGRFLRHTMRRKIFIQTHPSSLEVFFCTLRARALRFVYNENISQRYNTSTCSITSFTILALSTFKRVRFIFRVENVTLKLYGEKCWEWEILFNVATAFPIFYGGSIVRRKVASVELDALVLQTVNERPSNSLINAWRTPLVKTYLRISFL